MSRGPGSAQRSVLALCDDRWVSVEWLTKLRAVQHIEGEWERGEAVFRLPPPSRAQIETVRRAVHRLAELGLVETRHHSVEVGCHYRTPRHERIYADDRYHSWFGSRRLLEVRRPNP